MEFETIQESEKGIKECCGNEVEGSYCLCERRLGKLEQTKEIIKVIESRIRICDKSLEATQDEKWIHIKIVLYGIIKELKGEDK